MHQNNYGTITFVEACSPDLGTRTVLVQVLKSQNRYAYHIKVLVRPSRRPAGAVRGGRAARQSTVRYRTNTVVGNLFTSAVGMTSDRREIENRADKRVSSQKQELRYCNGTCRPFELAAQSHRGYQEEVGDLGMFYQAGIFTPTRVISLVIFLKNIRAVPIFL